MVTVLSLGRVFYDRPDFPSSRPNLPTTTDPERNGVDGLRLSLSLVVSRKQSLRPGGCRRSRDRETVRTPDSLSPISRKKEGKLVGRGTVLVSHKTCYQENTWSTQDIISFTWYWRSWILKRSLINIFLNPLLCPWISNLLCGLFIMEIKHIMKDQRFSTNEYKIIIYHWWEN